MKNRILTTIFAFALGASILFAVKQAIDTNDFRKDILHKVSVVSTQNKTLDNDVDVKLDTLNQKVNGLEKEVTNVKKQINKNTGDIQAQSDRLDELNNDIESVKK